MPLYAVPDFLPALPEIFLGAAALALLMVGVFRGEGSTTLVSWLSVLAFLIAIGLVTDVGAERQVSLQGMFITDGFGAFMKILSLIGSALSVVIGLGYNQREGMARFEFPVLVVLSTAGMMMMISAYDLISLYIGLELQSLALYVLASFQRDSVRSTEAGLKYFVLGALASGMLLFGASMVYGFAGTTSFDGLAQVFESGGGGWLGLLVGIVFIVVGLAFKVSAVPFHMWTPDVYEGAPTPVTAFFSVAPKIAALALFVRVMIDPFGKLVGEWRQVIEVISIASMILGALAAINQQNIKRLMAYSSIGHVGYALIGLAAATEVGVRGILVYMAIYLVMNIGAFTVILCMRRQGRMVERIDDLAGLARTQPGLALALAIFLFSLASVPPLAGFWAKLYVFMAAIDARLYTLAVIGVLASVVGSYYYVRIVKVMYFDEPAPSFDRPVGPVMGTVLAVSAVLVLLFSAFPSPLVDSAAAAAATLFAG